MGPAKPSRRRFIRRIALVAGALVGGRAVWSLARERKSIGVRSVRVRLAALPEALEGFTICQLSDLHAGPLVAEEQIRRSAALAMTLQADLIVLTGDYVSRSASYAERCARGISSLRAPQGVYGVLGNHDYWTGEVERVTDAIAGAGVGMLVNRSVPVDARGGRLWLCGLDDAWSGNPDLEAAVAEVPDDGFAILLCHEPDFADRAAASHVSLQLSGHSHGGQVRIPGIGALILPYLGRKYDIGLQRVGSSGLQVYTNVGVGVVGPPVRLNCPPEVTLFTLSRS